MIRTAAAFLLSLALAAPAASQKRIEHSGPYVQASSATIFPERVGDFRRASLAQYDTAGDDVSATYNLYRPAGRLVVTVYVYRPPQPGRGAGSAQPDDARKAALCNAEFDQTARHILDQYKGEVAENGNPVAADGVPAGLSRRSVYTMSTVFDGEEQPVRSELDLYCYVAGQWQVKYRATSHPGVDVQSELRTFIRTGPWPGRPAPEAPSDAASAARAAASGE
jgi:hypothetical protein